MANDPITPFNQIPPEPLEIVYKHHIGDVMIHQVTRFPVPGGWLYTTTSRVSPSSVGFHTTTTFVPDPAVQSGLMDKLRGTIGNLGPI